MHKKPLVGVSRCLLGDAVRYDGRSKPDAVVIEQLSEIFELVAICPEVEAGIGIPRPPVQLTGSIEAPRMTGRDDPAIDVSDQLQAFCKQRIPELGLLAGFIFKSRSPSCGLASTPIFIDGECVTESADGVFARTIKEHYTHIAMIDEVGLCDTVLREDFIDKVTQATPH